MCIFVYVFKKKYALSYGYFASLFSYKFKLFYWYSVYLYFIRFYIILCITKINTEYTKIDMQNTYKQCKFVSKYIYEYTWNKVDFYKNIYTKYT